MQLVKITCELRFSERISLLKGYETIHKDVLKKAPEHPEQWLIPGLIMDDKEKKRSWIVDQQRGIIDIEQPDVNFCRSSIIEFFNSIDKNLGFPPINRYGLRSIWISEYSKSFQELLKTIKENTYKNLDLINKANDVCVVFDNIIDTGKKISVTTGPMEYQQLKVQFLRFESQSIPKVFLFVAADMGDTNTKGFSSKYLNEFVDKSISEGQKLTQDVVKALGV